MARKKQKKIKPRNPYADMVRMEACYRQKVSKSDEERRVHRDVWDRKGKYRKNIAIDIEGE